MKKLHKLEHDHHATQAKVVKILKNIYDHCGVVCEQCEKHWTDLEGVHEFELHAGELEGECKKYADFKDEMDHHGDEDWEEEEKKNPFAYSIAEDLLSSESFLHLGGGHGRAFKKCKRSARKCRKNFSTCIILSRQSSEKTS